MGLDDSHRLCGRLRLLLLIFLFIALNARPLYAAWVALDQHYQSPGLQTVYIDPDSICRDGSFVTLWQLTDYQWKQGNIIGSRRVFSTKTRKQFDCLNHRLRLLSYTDYLGHMGTLRPADGYVDQDVWIPVRPGSIDQALYDGVCGKP